jgi:VanZ family protein
MAQMTAPTTTRLATLLLPPLVWMAVIFFLSAQPSDEIDRAWWDVLARKIAHVTEYAVLTALWWRAFRALGLSRPLGAAVVIAFAYAITDEWHQTFVDGRTGTPVDVLIDSIGIAIAVAAITFFDRRWRTSRVPEPLHRRSL